MVAPAVIAIVLAVMLVARQDDGAQLAAGADGGRLSVAGIELDVDGEPWAVVGGADGTVRVLSRGEGGATLTSIGGGLAPVALPSDAAPDALVAGTDRAIWMTDPAGSRVLRVDEDGELTSFPTDAPPSSSATWLAGRFWFAEPTLDRITGIDADGSVVHHSVPPGRAPAVVAAGPDGSVWFASSTEARIGSVSTSGTVNELDLDDGDERVVAMTTGPGPSLWMVATGPNGTRLTRLDAQGRVVGEPIVVARVPLAISLGPDGRLWYTSGGSTVQQRSVTGLVVGDLGRALHADSWALVGDDSMWAVDRSTRELVRIATG